MTQPPAERSGSLPTRAAPPYGQGSSANLADILERVLDKGIVIAGDIQINLLDIELLTIKLRLLVASVDKAKEMGIDWWEHDPSLSSRARGSRSLAEENRRLRKQIAALREDAALPADEDAYEEDAEEDAEDVLDADEADEENTEVDEDAYDVEAEEDQEEPVPRAGRSAARGTRTGKGRRR